MKKSIIIIFSLSVLASIVILIIKKDKKTFYPEKNECCSQSKNTNKIISIGGSITEILYLLESEDDIIAVDVTSTYPRETSSKKSIGYIRNLSVEGVLSCNPSLIISEDDIGPPIIIDQINKSGVDLRIIYEEKTLEGIIDKIKCISKIINKETTANKIINSELNPKIKEIKNLRKNQKLKDLKIMMILSMQGSSPTVAGGNTSGDAYIKMLGAKNIYESIEGWKSVTSESILNLNPDIIILPEREMHKNSNTKIIMNNELFQKTSAGKNNAFIMDDGMAILGYGPRTIYSLLTTLKTINNLYLNKN